MDWQLKKDKLIIDTQPYRYTFRITATGSVHMNLQEYTACEPWLSFARSTIAVQELTADQQGTDLLIHGGNTRIRITQEQEIILENKSEVFFTIPEHGFTKEKDALTLRIKLKDDEKIFGLGQDPMANLNQNGCERRMWNQWNGGEQSGNCGIGFYMSDAGYGLLLNSSSDARFLFGKSRPPVLSRLGEMMVPSLWKKGEPLPVTEAKIEIHDSRMDLYILPGKSPQVLLNEYYTLTGYPKPMPKWAYGFLQCKNRYMNRQDLINTARIYREKKIPCDGLIIDWLWFSDFGDLEWREDDWPEAEGMLQLLNGMGYHVSSAQHPFISETGKYYSYYKNQKYLNLVPEAKRITYDHTNPEARAYWWEKVKKLYEQGLRGYWIDMGELEEHFEGTVSHGGDRTRTHNAYSYLWSKGLYEGQRRDFGTRPFILSRSGSAGIQKFGTAIWSGDINSSWKVLKDQVVIGQGMAMSGVPNWTTDVGGFYSGKELTQELFLRWTEWGAFCGLFRTHGTRPENEAWSFGETCEDKLKQIINLRYRLIPYIYSLALSGVFTGTPMVRPMAFDYMNDKNAVSCTDQYLFGPSLLVAPVTSPGQRSRRVYLPEGIWYSWWSGSKLKNGWHKVSAPLGQLPLFVKAGSILPVYATIGNCVAECGGLTLMTFPGQSGSFDYYDDDGETFAYENGQFTHTRFIYDDNSGVVSAEAMNGSVPEYQLLTFRGDCGYRDIMADAVMNSDGTTSITLSFDRDFSGLVELQTGEGWRIITCSAEDYDNLNMFEAMKSNSWKKEITRKRCEVITWELSYTLNYIPVSAQKANIRLIEADGKSEIPLSFGSNYLGGFSLAGCFRISEQDGLHTVYAPEKEPELLYYQDSETNIYWQKDPQYGLNPFGYVDFRRLKPYQDKEEISGTAYAKSTVFVKEETEAEFILRHDSPIKIWMNNQEIYVSTERNARDITIRMKLQAGRNCLLIKQTARVARPYSGGEFGFSLKYMGEDFLWMSIC